MKNTVENINSLKLNQRILVTSTFHHHGLFFDLLVTAIQDVIKKDNRTFIYLTDTSNWGCIPFRSPEEVATNPIGAKEVFDDYIASTINPTGYDKQLADICMGGEWLKRLIASKKYAIYVSLKPYVAGIDVRLMENKGLTQSLRDGNMYKFNSFGSGYITLNIKENELENFEGLFYTLEDAGNYIQQLAYKFI